MAESQALSVLGDNLNDDPSQLPQALPQRAGSAQPLQFTIFNESHHSIDSAADFTAAHHVTAAPQLPVALAQLKHAPSLRRATTARNVRPSLHKNDSAPTIPAFDLEVDGAQQRRSSFADMDAPGDTQPDSQMHRYWTSADHGAAEISRPGPGPRSLFVEHEEDDDEGEDGDMLTDSIEGVGSSPRRHSPVATSPTVLQEDGGNTGVHAEQSYTSPFKFETPAVASRRTDGSGQLLSSATRTITTPATVASASAFGAGFGNDSTGQLMSLTQAYNATQAPTSPAINGVIEDPVFQRPSPNFTHARKSSPIPAVSSPIKFSRAISRSDPVVRSSSEPRTEYITMRESQERRKPNTSVRQQSALHREDSWDELSRRVIQKKANQQARERFDRDVAKSLSYISAPTLASSRSVKRSAVKSRERSIQDSPDGFFRDFSKHDNVSNNIEVPKTSSHPDREHSGFSSLSPSQHETTLSQFRAPVSQSFLRESFRLQSSRESVAVMDSQPDMSADFDSIPRPKSLRFPSSPSVGQYSINQTTVATKTGYTSQVVSSSMPPMPPNLSPEEMDETQDEIVPGAEERVPSSPPVLYPPEDDVTQHTYDEYAEGEDCIAESGIVDEDTVMDEDDDLPATEREPSVENLEIGEYQEKQEAVLIQPGKTDLETNQEVPETIEQNALPDDDVVMQSRYMEEEQDVEIEELSQIPPRLYRHDTIPETDALDETQPSFFPETGPVTHTANVTVESLDGQADVPDGLISNEAPPTARQDHSGLHVIKSGPASPKDAGSDAIQIDDRMRSFHEIANLPETQQSDDEEIIEIPRLSGLDANEGDVCMTDILPAPPLAKRRKVMYSAKKKGFPSPIRPVVEPLSDAPPSSPLSRNLPIRGETPPTASTQAWEDKGAFAAVQAREEAQNLFAKPATLKKRGLARPSKAQHQRKGALKPVARELLQALSSPINTPSKPKAPAPAQTITSPLPIVPSIEIPKEQVDTTMQRIDEETAGVVGPPPEAAIVEQMNKNTLTPLSTPSRDVVVPNRVFALWPGSHYYPATCIGRSSSRQYHVRYDDGNTTFLEAHQVRALNLRTGDHVKVDETGMKKQTYVVVGFKDRVEDLDHEECPTTDQFGHATVVLEEKQRDSLPAAKAIQPAKQIAVPVASIYLTTQLQKRLRDRAFDFSPALSLSRLAEQIETPARVAVLNTPSFTRRGTGVAPSLLKDATARAGSVASTVRSGSGVFLNMAFVITSTAGDVDKDATAKLIKVNGGQVLEHGFHELFELESSDESPPSQSRRRSSSVVENFAGLTLKSEYQDLGFVALISDSHSRSTKYIQALALNVPCLHLRWIQDSLSASHTLSFARYLLPAGVSKFLDPNGVLRSRTMRIYDPSSDSVSFAQTIKDRDLLLHNQSVLLITGKSKKEIEKRQPFVFLTHALGAANVGQCADVNAATQMLQNSHWDWVYVDNGEKSVADAAKELFGVEKTVGAKSGKRGKKRRREGSEERGELVSRGEIGGRKVKITCAEFVIQSLILGALVEE